MAKKGLIADIAQLAPMAAETQKGRMALFNQTELANIPHTPENIDKAIQAVKFITEQTRSLITLTCQQRGMYLCWLKANYTQHGEWQQFCEEHFPEIPNRTRQYWMATYLTAIGEKKPRELPKYDPDELEDSELSDAVENLSTDKRDLAPRKALLDMLKKQEKQIAKGLKDMEALREQLQLTQSEAQAAQAGRFIPESVTAETDRIEHIRNEFGSFLNFWIQNFATDLDAMRLHKSLHAELQDVFSDFWTTQMLPHCESLQQATKGKSGKPAK